MPTADDVAQLLSSSMSVDHARERYYVAVLALVGSGSLNERLTFAAESLLHLRPDELPNELRNDHAEIMRKLTRDPLSSEWGYVRRKLRGKNAYNVAKAIFNVFVKLQGGI